MDLHIEFPAGPGPVHVTITGALAVSEYPVMLSRVFADPSYRVGMPILWDLRHATLGSLTRHDFEYFDHVNAGVVEQHGPGRVALLVSDDLHYGLARQYQIVTDTTRVQRAIFRDLDEARAWVTGAGR